MSSSRQQTHGICYYIIYIMIIIITTYSTMLNFGVLPLVKIDHVMQVSLLSGCLFLAIFAQNLALYNKNKSPSVSGPTCMCDRFPWKFDVQYKPSNVIFVVNIKFPRATYHTMVPSTEELYCLNWNSGKIFKLKYLSPQSLPVCIE